MYKNRLSILLWLIIGCGFALHSQPASRITNSPYAVTNRPDTLCLININGFTSSQQLTTATLQGLLAVTKPRIIVMRGNLNFQTDLTQHYGLIFDSSYINYFAGLITHFTPNIGGYLLCNVNSLSANVAISACRFFNAIAVTPADTALMNTLNIPQLYDVRNKDQHWVFDTFQPRFSKKIITYQDTTKCSYLPDYSIMAGALHYWDATLTNFSDTIYNNLLPNSVMMGWGPDEHTTVLQASQHGTMVHASDWASNLSVYSNMDVQVAQHALADDTNIIPGTHTVCFVMTDGDNVQWLTNDFASSHNWYGSTRRGITNIGWTISPAMAELGPTVMKYLYDSAANTATGKDYFIAGPSGMGYYYPDNFTNLDSAAAITARMMQKADLHILNIIGDHFADSLFEHYLKYPNIDAIFYYDYSNYSAELGRFACVKNKPVICAKLNLWNFPSTPDLISAIINAQPKTPDTILGYSLIDVNVWTNNVDSVLSCVSKFDSTVRVVGPDAFIKLLKRATGCQPEVSGISDNVNPPSAQLNIYPNPASDVLHVETGAGHALTLEVYNSCGQKVLTPAFSSYINISGLPPGAYILTATFNGTTRRGRFIKL